VRGKTGRVYGHLVSLLTLMKGQPLAYNKDNQEDKEPLFDTVDTLAGSLRAFADMVPNLRTNAVNMLASTRKGFSTATDLADYLVGRGLPFRDAHEVVGRAVRLAAERGCDLAELPLADLQGFDARIGEDVYDLLTPAGSAAARDLPGGTAPAQVLLRVAEAREALAREDASPG